MLDILLIDDHVIEKKILTIHLMKAGYSEFKIKQVSKCSEALQDLFIARYDIVLLDNALGDCISAEFSVPFIKGHLHGAPLVIISNNIDVPHLKSPDVLGVDYVVNKENLSDFMIKLLPLFPSVQTKVAQ